MVTEVPSLEEFASPEYWNARYVSEQKNGEESGNGLLESYDWFRTFDKIRPFLLKYLPPASKGFRIIHLGCGNSVGSYRCPPTLRILQR